MLTNTITAHFQDSFDKAVTNPENIMGNGHVNWNFVDADVYMDMQPVDGETHYNHFEYLATQFEAVNGVQSQPRQ